MNYDAPAHADTLGPAISRAWNDALQRMHRGAQQRFPSRHFVAAPEDSGGERESVRALWTPEPLEASICVGPQDARLLCDWGVRGRFLLHNEFAEYTVLEAPDQRLRLRPKRVEVTTELREFWMTVATDSPDGLRILCEETLGFTPSWRDLYRTDDPFAMTPAQRRIAFAREMAGHGGEHDLIAAGIGATPAGWLNRRHALFLTHPLNGADDLIETAVAAAQPFARRRADGATEPASHGQILRARAGAGRLGSRHRADDAIVSTIHRVVFAGARVGFANPPGITIAEIDRTALRHRGEPVPDSWFRLSRGAEGLPQRLVFGPDDSEAAFLDEVWVRTPDGRDEPLLGGYRLLQCLRLAVRFEVTPAHAATRAEPVLLSLDENAPDACRPDICEPIHHLLEEYHARQ